MIREWLVQLMEWMVGEEVMLELFAVDRVCSTCDKPLYELLREHRKIWHGDDSMLPAEEWYKE